MGGNCALSDMWLIGRMSSVRALTLLESNELRVYSPLIYTRIRLHNLQKYVLKKELAYPGYMFIHCDDVDDLDIRYWQINFLMREKKVIVIGQDLIDLMKSYETMWFEEIEPVENRFEVGQIAEIVHGVFVGTRVMITRIEKMKIETKTLQDNVKIVVGPLQLKQLCA